MAYRLTLKQRRALDRLANSSLARALTLPVEGRALKGRAIANRLRIESARWAVAFAIGPALIFSILYLIGLAEGQPPASFLAPVGGLWFVAGLLAGSALLGAILGRRTAAGLYRDVEMQQADAPDFFHADVNGLRVTGPNGFRLEGPWARWAVTGLATYPDEGRARGVGRLVVLRSLTLALDADGRRAVTLDPLLLDRGAALCAVVVRALDRAGAFAL
ncbi:hypothetical protein D3874_12760 [Oleomonas cavernae]|uniref:Uncharacterized protein n=1 Tax=Oleomonas cavernae TaxID=2320859 RepID=A0A418WCT1_9PROT|nr:hypothetical protein [Oleomonas cavernae]RJF87786.1 hypothetical protein D3874_12760 [Oleomonas cavernae]